MQELTTYTTGLLSRNGTRRCYPLQVNGGLLAPNTHQVLTLNIDNNWAFVDAQNLYQGVKEKGWKINWKLFRKYLREKLNVQKAIVFMGFKKENAWLYRQLDNAGFTLEFRDIKILKDGTIDGGNIDADLASYVMDHKNEYNQAVVIADDSDYCNTLKSLARQNKLLKIISSHLIEQTSLAIKKAIGIEKIISIHNVKELIERCP